MWDSFARGTFGNVSGVLDFDIQIGAVHISIDGKLVQDKRVMSQAREIPNPNHAHI